MVRPICCLVGLVLVILVWRPSAAFADDPVIIYVDTSSIDEGAIPNLTTEQKTTLASLLLQQIQNNFDAAVGAGAVKISNKTADRSNAKRIVNIIDNVVPVTDGRDKDSSVYGRWWREAKEANVYLYNFLDRHCDLYQNPDGSYDVGKLANGLSWAASHELGHSYSLGHNMNGTNITLMTDGHLVNNELLPQGGVSFSEDWAKKLLQWNIGCKPCKTTFNVDIGAAIKPLAYGTPHTENGASLDVGCFNASLDFSGPLASQFDLGWYGEESDGGADGNANFDFVFKSSLTGIPGEDAPWLAFFEEQHSTAQFLLRGVAGGEFAGQWFPMCKTLLNASNVVFRPDGQSVYQLLTIGWDVDGVPGTDVQIVLNAANVYEYPGGEYNGWIVVAEPKSVSLLAPLLLALGAVALFQRLSPFGGPGWQRLTTRRPVLNSSLRPRG